MKVVRISDTIQEFNGERFYLCGNYFQHKGKRLHVAVWKHHNGEIPHGSGHASAPEREVYNRKHIEDMRALAAEWHGSANGKAWHSEHAKESWQKRGLQQYVCMCCGKTFETKSIYGENVNTFCGNNCKSEYRRRSGIDNEERVCAYCGKTFIVNKYARAKCCSRECAVKKRWEK